MSPKIRRALISVSDKRALGEFAQGLTAAGVQIYSTGGTARQLTSLGMEVVDVSAYTGFPEMMDGRLKTLHPKVFGGILCRHDRSSDMEAIAAHQINPFELVVVNLYPFESTIAQEGVTDAEAIEQIDIGGPSLVRAAAKNHKFVTVCTQPEQYTAVLTEIEQAGSTTLELRRQLACEAFTMTAAYDRAIAEYFTGQTTSNEFPAALNFSLRRKAVLRYGENPHQRGAVYEQATNRAASVVSARQLNGKELSYNNLLDLDSALTIARQLASSPAAVVIKHNNPCGAATAATLQQAAEKAMAGDPVSAFGSVLGFNRTVDRETAEFLSTPGFFIEAIVAPEFDPAAVDVLTSKPKWKHNVRLMQVGQLQRDRSSDWQYRFLAGGLLVQDADAADDRLEDWQVVTEKRPTDAEHAELRFAWSVVRQVKSNAIVLTKDQAVCGVGAGQMSRVDAVELAIRKAGSRSSESVLASDAFFPFPDSIDHAADAGVTAVIQPGGSKKDPEVIAACNDRGLAMIFTGRRHFKH